MTIYEQLKRDEGLRLKTYKDSVGKLTIGYGRNLDDEGISQREAETLLVNDVERVLSQLVANGFPEPNANVNDPVYVRYAVLINMAFNMGIGSEQSGKGLLGFQYFMNAYRAGDYSRAASEMLQSRWAQHQVPERALRLAKQMELGEWT